MFILIFRLLVEVTWLVNMSHVIMEALKIFLFLDKSGSLASIYIKYIGEFLKAKLDGEIDMIVYLEVFLWKKKIESYNKVQEI